MKRVWLFGLASIIITALFTGHNISTQHRAILDHARSDTERLVQFLALDAERTFYGTQQMFDGISNLLSSANTTPQKFSPHFRTILLELKNANPFLMDLLILDAHGDIIHWTGPGTPPMVRDREYTSAHMQSKPTALYIGTPQLSRVHKNQWFFGNSRALRHEDGSLAYILVAITDLQYFEQRYLDLQLPMDASLALFSETGEIYTRLPQHQDFVGTRIEIPPVELQRLKETTTLRIVSPLDQKRRLASFRKIEGTPLIAAVSFSEEEILAPWITYAWLVGFFGFLAIAALSGMTWIIVRFQRKQLQLKSLFHEQSITDSLTGVANRRHAMEICQHEVQRTCRYKTQLSLVLVDIDHFKQINDQYGHDVGDVVLKQFAQLLQDGCRQSDLVSRIGGEEFLLVLSDTNYTGALALAEKIRGAVSSNLFHTDDGPIRIKASMGVATLSENETDISATFKRADKALYKAKHEGRNRVA